MAGVGRQRLPELHARRLVRPIASRSSGRRGFSCGWLPVGLSGIAYVGQGWVLGSKGFSAGNTYPTLSGIVLALAWPRGSGVVAQDLCAAPSRNFGHAAVAAMMLPGLADRYASRTASRNGLQLQHL
jgi:hypothetical protein